MSKRVLGAFAALVMVMCTGALVQAHPAKAVKARPTCSIARAELCSSSNDLVWSKGFRPVLAGFVGPVHKDWLSTDGALSQSAWESLIVPEGGSPEGLDDGSLLFSGCRSHSCPEKGAIVIRDGRILAVALLNFHCKAVSCDDLPTLDILIHDRALEPTLVPALTRWGRRFKRAKADAKPSGPMPVEVLRVPMKDPPGWKPHGRRHAKRKVG
jgi:hypothetical protein